MPAGDLDVTVKKLQERRQEWIRYLEKKREELRKRLADFGLGGGAKQGEDGRKPAGTGFDW